MTGKSGRSWDSELGGPDPVGREDVLSENDKGSEDELAPPMDIELTVEREDVPESKSQARRIEVQKSAEEPVPVPVTNRDLQSGRSPHVESFTPEWRTGGPGTPGEPGSGDGKPLGGLAPDAPQPKPSAWKRFTAFLKEQQKGV